MRRLFIAFLVAGTFLGAGPATPDVDGAPALDVAVFPYRGVIPAKFANGRTVYLFRAWVAKQRVNDEQVIVVQDEKLLQAGMSEKLHARSGDLELRGAITIEEGGATQYRATVAKGGEPILTSATHLVLGSDPRSKRFSR